MSQLDLLPDSRPNLLRMLSWLGPDVVEETQLPLMPGDYKVTPGDVWTVTNMKTREVVYRGIGPVEVLRSPAPF